MNALSPLTCLPAETPGYRRADLRELLPEPYAKRLPPDPDPRGNPSIEALHCGICILIIARVLHEGEAIDRLALVRAREAEQALQLEFKRRHAERQRRGLIS